MKCELCGETADELVQNVCTKCAAKPPADFGWAYTPPEAPCLKFTVDIVQPHGL